MSNTIDVCQTGYDYEQFQLNELESENMKLREKLDNFEVFRVFYPDEFEQPDEVDLIERGSLVDYVNGLIPSGIISDEALEIFNEKHQYGVQTEADAVELLETDGFNVRLTKVWKKGK